MKTLLLLLLTIPAISYADGEMLVGRENRNLKLRYAALSCTGDDSHGYNVRVDDGNLALYSAPVDDEVDCVLGKRRVKAELERSSGVPATIEIYELLVRNCFDNGNCRNSIRRRTVTISQIAGFQFSGTAPIEFHPVEPPRPREPRCHRGSPMMPRECDF